MDLLSSMRAFVAIASHGGFAAAARELQVSTSSLTRRMDALEGYLGVKLLIRTTRRVTLTESGHQFLLDAIRILDDVSAATRDLAESDDKLSGVLRIAAAPSIGATILPPLLKTFLNTHPAVTFDLTLTDHVVDLIDSGVDVAIRIGNVDSTPDLVIRNIRPMRRVVCASPVYIETFGLPMIPMDLQQHDCLLFRPPEHESLWRARREIWYFRCHDNTYEVMLKGRIASNDADSLVAAARQGLGIILMPDWLVAQDLTQQRLVQILENFDVGPFDDGKSLHLAYPAHRRHVLKVRSFCAHVESSLGLALSD